jgi:predicted metalloprotease with PDZ domain
MRSLRARAANYGHNHTVDEWNPMKDLLIGVLCAVFAIAAITMRCAGGPLETSSFLQLSLHSELLEVRWSYPASEEKTTTFMIDDWAGVPDFNENISMVRAKGDDGEAFRVEHPESHLWIVHHNGKPFNLSYQVTSPKESFIGKGRTGAYMPTLLKQRALLWGHTFVLYPTSDSLFDLPVRTSISSSDYANPQASWDLNETQPMSDVINGLLAAGDYRMTEKKIMNTPVTFLASGSNWRFTDDEFVSTVGKILQLQADSMGFYPAPRLMIALMEGNDNHTGGSVGRHAMFIYPNPKHKLDEEELSTLRLISHENFHVWNGQHLHPSADQGEGYYNWFHEGVTDYVANWTLYKAGLMSDEGFVRWANSVLQEYQTSPIAFTATANDLAKNYWTSSDHQRLPYVKGAAVALLIDLRMREETGGEFGLIHFVKALAAESYPNGYQRSDLSDGLAKLSGTDWSEFLDQYVWGAEALPIVHLFDEFGVSHETKPTPKFDLGYAAEGSPISGQVVRITPGSSADKAGVRAGDQIMGGSIRLGDPTRKISLVIDRDGERLTLEYFPTVDADIIRVLPSKGTVQRFRGLK